LQSTKTHNFENEKVLRFAWIALHITTPSSDRNEILKEEGVIMASHNASGQMFGYLYQVRYALKLLMSSGDPSYQISIEKFDDIAFDKEGTPVQLIQAKHHTTPASLTDISIDLWRTLNVWFDAIAADISLLKIAFLA
jgi:hypothetical protein